MESLQNNKSPQPRDKQMKSHFDKKTTGTNFATSLSFTGINTMYNYRGINVQVPFGECPELYISDIIDNGKLLKGELKTTTIEYMVYK